MSAANALTYPFRVHFVDGTKIVVHAGSAKDARTMATERRPGTIDKIKRDRSGEETRA